MRGESQLEVAILVLLTAEYYSDDGGNSELIGEAAGCSPVVVRRIYSRLKDAGLLDTKPGRYGLHLARGLNEISLLDVIAAIRPLDAESVFGVASPLSGTTPISNSLYTVLSEELEKSIVSMTERLATVTLSDIVSQFPATYDVPLEEKKKALDEYMVAAEKRHS